jgi:hypothetical protein
VNPPTGSRWVLSADGGESGLGSTPVRGTVRRVAPGVSGGEACLVPGPGPCAPVSGSLVWNVPASLPGYLVFRGRVLDRGGNRSGEVVARVLRDTQAPEVEAPSLPSTLVGGVTRSFASVARDNVDLHLGQVRLRFARGGRTRPSLRVAGDPGYALPGPGGSRGGVRGPFPLRGGSGGGAGGGAPRYAPPGDGRGSGSRGCRRAAGGGPQPPSPIRRPSPSGASPSPPGEPRG